MGLISIMNYQNGHLSVALSTLNAFLNAKKKHAFEVK